MERRLSAMSSVLNSTEVFPSLISQSDALLNAIAEVRSHPLTLIASILLNYRIASQVKGSGKLKFLLRTYLDLNNALAVQAGLSPSTGFQLSSWRKLSQTKTNNGETMEQYVIGKLAATVPEALELGGDFPSLDEGRQVILSRLQMEVRKLNEGVALLNDLLAAESPDSPSAQNLQKHIEQLSQLLTKAKHHVDMAQTEFSDLLTYFGYVHSSGGNAEPEAFFVEIKDLCRNVSEALARNQTKARRKAIRS